MASYRIWATVQSWSRIRDKSSWRRSFDPAVGATWMFPIGTSSTAPVLRLRTITRSALTTCVIIPSEPPTNTLSPTEMRVNPIPPSASPGTFPLKHNVRTIS